jgi:uncharacterized protein DUF4019
VKKYSPILIALVLAACSFGADRDASVRAVDRIRAQVAAGDYHAIYAEASEEARSTSTESQLESVFRAVRDLGVPSESRMTGWEVQTDASGTLVTLEYASTYGSMPQLLETFSLRSENGAFRLHGYDNNLP